MMTVLKIFGIFVLVYVGLSLLLGVCGKTFLKVTKFEPPQSANLYVCTSVMSTLKCRNR